MKGRNTPGNFSPSELLLLLVRHKGDDQELQDHVVQLINEDPGRFIPEAWGFLNLPLDHLLSFLHALKAREANETLLWDWAYLLEFLESLLSDDAASAPEEKASRVVAEVAVLLKRVLHQAVRYGLYDTHPVHVSVKGHVETWARLLSSLLHFPEACPPQDTASKVPTSPVSLAFDALLSLGFILKWDAQKRQPVLPFSLKAHPEVEWVFLQVLHSPSPTLHRLLGANISSLENIDWAWLLSHQHEVFPTTDVQRYQTTLQAYLKEALISAPQVEHMQVFLPLVDALVRDGMQGENLRLLTTLVHLLKFGELPVNSWVIQKVFNDGPLEVRFEYLRQLGSMLMSRDHDEWVDHALVLWEWRKKEVLAGQVEPEELEAFESWLHAEMHENQKLTELLFVLTHTAELKRLRPEIILIHLSYNLEFEPLLTTQVLKVLTERHTLKAELRLKALSLLKQALGFRASKPLAEETLEKLALQGWKEKHPPEPWDESREI